MVTAPPISKETFDRAPPYEKGYLVYWYGCRDDQPNVPAEYTPTVFDREEYERGRNAAILAAQDNP